VETPHHGRWFEDLPVGLVVPHALTRTITETDNVLFTTMTLNPARLHLDAEYAAGTEFGRPLVNSLFTLGLLVGISVLETTHGTTVANLGFEEVVFPTPMFAGDTLHAVRGGCGAGVKVAPGPGDRDLRAPRLQPA
jgi:acyl dehydratase